MNRVRIGRTAVVVGAAIVLVGCGPTVTVRNETTIPIRAILMSNDGSETFAPTPGESSSAEASEGPYRVVAVPDADWVEYAKLTRKVLNEQLANSDNLSGPQLLDLVRRLKDVAAKMKQMEGAAGSTGACAGKLTQDSSALATVTVAADGRLVVSCK